jgi:hypothetical protein
MQRTGIARFAPLTGVLFLVVAVIAFVVGGDPPDVDEPAARHQEYWVTNNTDQDVSAILGAYAAVLLVWFAGSVREAIARVEPGPSRLASISFAGAAIAATGLLANSAIQFAAAETAGRISADGTHTLSALWENFFFPMAGGMALFLFAAGLGALRHEAFDRVLAGLAVGIGVVCLTPAGFFGFIAALVWSAIAGIVLYRKKDPVGSGAEPPRTPGPPIEIPPGAGPPAPS